MTDDTEGRTASLTEEFRCRFCRSGHGDTVLDVGLQPAADHFPALDEPGPDATTPLAMWLCRECGLAQLVENLTVPEEPRGQEPEALILQAQDAISQLVGAGLLRPGQLFAEYGSPHGGSWSALIEAAGLTSGDGEPTVDVLVDNIGMMHDADQAAALAARAERLRPDGLLLFQFHSLASIVAGGQWNALRHGHFAYYSTPVLSDMLASVGLSTTHAFWFPLYGGTVLLAARRGGVPNRSVRDLVDRERAAGVLDAEVVGALQDVADTSARSLRGYLNAERAAGRTVLGYGAASRSVALLHHARVGPDLLRAIADGSPAKHGRRLSGSAIPIVSPAELVDARPDSVVLFVEDLLPEVRASLPEIESGGGRWVIADRIADHATS